MTRIDLWNGKTVPRIGIGCWAIGGAMHEKGVSLNYGGTNDADAKAGLNLAYELGARVFDTAAIYGGGHSEELLGEVFGNREDVVIVTKYGVSADLETREVNPADATPAGVRRSIEASRKRLQRDVIDCALLHIGDLPVDQAEAGFDELEKLRDEGKVDSYGWSTDFADRTKAVVGREHFVAVENDYNVFTPAKELMKVVVEHNLVAISRLPLAMGMLTGKYSKGEKVGAGDLRAEQIEWMRFFRDGQAEPAFVKRLDALRDLLQTGGRTLAQGALSWILAASPRALPVPGFRNEAQIRDNLGTLEKGPLPAETMAEIDRILTGFDEAA